MVRATEDPCVLISKKEGKLAGIIILQVDDKVFSVRPIS